MALSPLEALLQWHTESPDDILIEYIDLEDCTQKLSVSQITSIARSLACLISQNAAQNSVIGLNLQLEPDLVIAFYACWLSGCTPTVFNLAWSTDVRNGISKRLNISLVLYTALPPEDLPPNTQSLCIRDAITACAPLQQRDEPFYALINQSSGTTGLPKSVPVRMAMYAEFCPTLAPLLNKHFREAFVTAPSFSGVTAGIYLAPYSRCTMIYPKATAASSQGASAQEIADNICQALERESQAIFFTASLFGLADAQMPSNQTYPNLKAAAFGGELTPIESIQRARSRFPNATISIGFSSTESVQASFSCVIKPEQDVSSLTELVFAPNQNIEKLLLLDEDDKPIEPLTAGTAGRICVVTRASADPYIMEAGDKSAQDAIDDTFRPIEGDKKLICFADFGEYRKGNKIVVFGRSGRKIKINGVFVDLSFLDRVLSASPTILEAITLAVKNRIVCLYVPSSPGQMAAVDDFNRMLHDKTKITINQAFPVSSMPIASSGKKDWKALQSQAEELSARAAFPPIDASDQTALWISASLGELLQQPYLSGQDFSFGSIGPDSITAAHLANLIHRKYPKSKIKAETVLNEDLKPTLLSSLIRSGPSSEPTQFSMTFLQSEINRLSQDLPKLAPAPPTHPKSIVLTGATGYLGSYILAQLLREHPNAEILCIIRSQGKKRILEALDATQIEVEESALNRIVPITGDMALPDLGLSQADAARVQAADLIIHNAAVVHWTKSYKALLPANAGSLVYLLRHAKSLTFVSGGGQTALDDGIESAFVGANGYTLTKYVAEGICRKVGARIVRPGYIIGSPVCNSDDFLWRFIKSCVQLGSVVKLAQDASTMNAATVIYVADHTVCSTVSLDRIWVECHLQQFYDALNTLGYHLTEVSAPDWLTALEQNVDERSSDSPLYPLMGFVRDMGESLADGMGYPRPSDLPYEQLENGILESNMRYLQDVGYLPLPDKTYKQSTTRHLKRTG